MEVGAQAMTKVHDKYLLILTCTTAEAHQTKVRELSEILLVAM
jgi:hypothetical protein